MDCARVCVELLRWQPSMKMLGCFSLGELSIKAIVTQKIKCKFCLKKSFCIDKIYKHTIYLI